MLRRSAVLALCALSCAATLPAAAQSWPTRPVRILAGSPAGGPSDTVARLLAQELGKAGQPVVVENRPGAANGLAAVAAAQAGTDGHTLVLSPDTVLTVNPLVYKPQAGLRTELANLVTVASFSQMMVCHPKVGVRTLAELVTRSRSQHMTYASGGPGSPGHLAAEMALQASGAKMDHVPYRGPAPATTAVLAGEVDCGFLAGPTVLPHVKAGKLVPLAMSSATPSPLAPEVPSMAKALGQPELDATFRLVLQVAAGTPPAVQAAIEKATLEALQQPAVRQRLQDTDMVPVALPKVRTEPLMKAEIARWEPLVKRLDLKAD